MNRAFFTAAAAALVATANAETPNLEEMHRIIQQQQMEIDALKAQNQRQDEQVEATAQALEQASSGAAAGNAWYQRTHLGGYAEMHYNNLKDQGPAGNDKSELDFHRFVLFIGHDFNAKTRFYSELELEHAIASAEDEGEIELEQAYIEYDYIGAQQLKAGLFLVPVGILNETHEPDTFYGVERNPIEYNIIPSTWWEGGVAFNGRIVEGLSYDVAISSGLFIDVAAVDSDKPEFKVRSGRQKMSEARADALAYTGRLKYTGVRGLELAATVQYQEDVAQDTTAHRIPAVLLEAHLAYQYQGFGLRALYARWDIDDAIEEAAAGADEQTGWFVEPSYRFNDHIGIFARYSDWDNQAGASLDTAQSQLDIGLNYWLTDNVVFKFDYQNQDVEDDGARELDGFNLGVGWSF